MTLPRLRAFTDFWQRKLENRSGKPKRAEDTTRAKTPDEVLSIAKSKQVNPLMERAGDFRSGWGDLFQVVRPPKARAS